MKNEELVQLIRTTDKTHLSVKKYTAPYCAGSTIWGSIFYFVRDI